MTNDQGQMTHCFMKRAALTLLFLLTGCASYSVTPAKETSPALQATKQQTAKPHAKVTPLDKLIAAALEQVGVTTEYDPTYAKLKYPNGDVPLKTGVCADVIVRAFRQIELDLQKELHEDMQRNFAKYPKKWGLKAPDANIDHRRVPNLMTWFARQGKALPLSKEARDYLPGDVVAWDLGGGLTHIGLVSDLKADGTDRYLIVHNIGTGAQLEDRLFDWKVIGRYRYFASTESPKTSSANASPPVIGKFKNPAYETAGCTFYFPADYRRADAGYIFFTEAATDAIMKIDGKEVHLTLVKRSPVPATAEIGQKSWEVYRYEDVEVRIDQTLIRLLPNKENAVASESVATFTITRGPHRQVLKAKGGCGC